AKVLAVPTGWLPVIMKAPDFLFTRIASSMLAIDPHARSSMWEDLEQGRLTEVDWLNGEVVALAKSINRSAPVNEKITRLVHSAEQGSRRQWSGEELYAQLVEARSR
ncbi:MAG: ketopantoate reductase C-terminal domain-containing protein, partial [Oceanisphaera sp.]|nr:ketopantoate reductase C-terminal domain-containing protein [Oceanisphaera sp.]